MLSSQHQTEYSPTGDAKILFVVSYVFRCIVVERAAKPFRSFGHKEQTLARIVFAQPIAMVEHFVAGLHHFAHQRFGGVAHRFKNIKDLQQYIVWPRRRCPHQSIQSREKMVDIRSVHTVIQPNEMNSKTPFSFMTKKNDGKRKYGKSITISVRYSSWPVRRLC